MGRVISRQPQGQPSSGGGSPSGGVPGELEVTAEVTSDNTTGTSLVNIFLPCRPGDVTNQMITDRKITLEVNGVEQAVFVQAARGRHASDFRGSWGQDTVSVVHGHFTYNIPSVNTPITAKFIIGRVRSTTDLTETLIDDTHLGARRACYPTDPTYLCATELSLQPLIPASTLNAANLAYFVTYFDARFEQLKATELDAANYQSTYESNVALWAAYCMTGNRKYFWWPWRAARGFLKYSLPNNGTGFWVPEPNPQSIVTGLTSHGGLPNEQNSQRYRTFAVAYRITGQISYWFCVCNANSWINWANTSQSVAAQLDKVISNDEYGRFNLRGQWGVLLAFLIDSTKGMASSGGFTGRTDHVNQEAWMLNAWNTWPFNRGDHRDGMRGSHDTATSGGTVAGGVVPHFQWALLTDWLVMRQIMVKSDATVAGWIKTNVYAMLNDLVPSTSGQPGFGQGAAYGYEYSMTATQGGNASDPWTLPMWAASVKYVERYFGDDTVNGALLSAWYTRLINTGQVSTSHLNWSWKVFGESYGNNMMAPYLDQIGIPICPSAVRTPTQY